MTGVTNAIQMKLDGGGKKLGCQNMNLKLRTEYNMCAPKKIVSDRIWELDPDGLQSRKVWKESKRSFVCNETNYLFSLDGHDKMMGSQKSTFQLATYGCLDTL